MSLRIRKHLDNLRADLSDHGHVYPATTISYVNLNFQKQQDR